MPSNERLERTAEQRPQLIPAEMVGRSAAGRWAVKGEDRQGWAGVT